MPIRPSLLHQVYNQSLLSRRVMNQDVALVMYRRAIKACQAEDPDFRPTHPADEAGLVKFIVDLNEILEELGLEVRRAREDTVQGRQYVALVNIDASNETAAKGTDYSPLEIAYFRKVLEGIIESYPANSLGSNHALRLTDQLASTMTKSQGEQLLKTFVSRGWLSRSKRGRYSLAPRGQMELETWLRSEKSEEVYRCQRCEKVVMTGVACGSSRCEAHYHLYCHHPIRAQHCRGCNVSFSETPVMPIGEAAVSRNEDDRADGTRKRKRPTLNGTSGAGGFREDDNEGDEEAELESEDGPDRDETDEAATPSGTATGGEPARWDIDTQRRARKSRGDTSIPETQAS